jgi:xanthine dehydrogenase YagS FAD-binding subunit
MRPFALTRADSAPSAIEAQLAEPQTGAGAPSVLWPGQYLAGGTLLLDLMKLDVMRPALLTDINALEKSPLGVIDTANGLKLGALVRMSAAADHPEIRANYPVVSQSLQLAASQQLRNMASLGGNVLQRTRCNYFRDTSYANCNKRNPGSGCAAMDGINRMHAVLGTSEQCIASYPGDFAQALMALDAQVEVAGANGTRTIPFAQLHRAPGENPQVETVLSRGDLITAFTIPATPFAKRSLYLKVRDRASYEFALASAAIALDLDNGTVRDVRIALGGVATMPWRAREAEEQLKGKKIDEASLATAAAAAFAQAKPREHNAFKVELGKRTLVRALRQAAAMEI